ncbi:hypothetical protein H6P81_009613 [Aristolochia fimbriata]|uniref:Uncharacterized protein n=1 Tax=Aristolochia fimbriata TaxID=158543 RepID=A0AAV7ELE5_ARIFI|nr:hypothetical protein H6P81_009613 [Aristolochia fimbriata]
MKVYYYLFFLGLLLLPLPQALSLYCPPRSGVSGFQKQSPAGDAKEDAGDSKARTAPALAKQSMS